MSVAEADKVPDRSNQNSDKNEGRNVSTHELLDGASLPDPYLVN